MSVKPVAEPVSSPADRYSPEEWATRVELAACYRLLSKFRMTDLTATHVSARVPGPEEHYLLNGWGLLFDQITASNLVKFDLDGNILDDTPYEMNPAGYAIHGAIHKVRPDAFCVMHTHTRAGCAVGALKEGLLPLNQISLIFYDRMAYTDYAMIEYIGECTELVEDLGDKRAMIMRNHGLLTTGTTIPEAFMLMFYLDKACEIQMDVLSTGREIELPPPDVCEDAAKRWNNFYEGTPFGQLDWDALMRNLEAEDTSYLT